MQECNARKVIPEVYTSFVLYCRQIFEILIIQKPSLWWRDVPQKIWARSVKPFWRLLDTNKQTDKPNLYIDSIKLAMAVGKKDLIITFEKDRQHILQSLKHNLTQNTLRTNLFNIFFDFLYPIFSLSNILFIQYSLSAIFSYSLYPILSYSQWR